MKKYKRVENTINAIALQALQYIKKLCLWEKGDFAYGFIKNRTLIIEKVFSRGTS